MERSVNLFPDTMIAIVALSIGLDAGGSSDLTAVLLMQELFDPKGRVEIMPLVDREIEVRSADWESMMADWRKRRSVSRQGHPLQDYIGRYRGLGWVILDTRPCESGGLGCRQREGRNCAGLEEYNVDMSSYLPVDWDDWPRGAWLDWDHYMLCVLHFHPDEASGRATGVSWTWEIRFDGAHHHFPKQSAGELDNKNNQISCRRLVRPSVLKSMSEAVRPRTFSRLVFSLNAGFPNSGVRQAAPQQVDVMHHVLRLWHMKLLAIRQHPEHRVFALCCFRVCLLCEPHCAGADPASRNRTLD
jgi:hypothetical protein